VTLLASTRVRSSGRLPLPPFGSRILEMIRRGEKPNVFICAGSDAWATHQLRLERIVLPPGSDPSAFDWDFMRGLQPTIVGADGNHTTLKKLAWVLLRAGCPLVALFYEDLQASALRNAAKPVEAHYRRGNVIRTMFFRND
jgi:hypothetical protein